MYAQSAVVNLGQEEEWPNNTNHCAWDHLHKLCVGEWAGVGGGIIVREETMKKIRKEVFDCIRPGNLGYKLNLINKN